MEISMEWRVEEAHESIMLVKPRKKFIIKIINYQLPKLIITNTIHGKKIGVEITTFIRLWFTSSELLSEELEGPFCLPAPAPPHWKRVCLAMIAGH